MVYNKNAVSVGVTMGIVFVIMGIASGNSGIWILGAIVLSIGLLFGTKED
jgi:hypothetical protein